MTTTTRARAGWYAAPDIEVDPRRLPRPEVLAGVGVAAVAVAVVLAVVDGPDGRLAAAWALSVAGTAVAYLALTVRSRAARADRGQDVRVDPRSTAWVMVAVGLALSLPRLVGILVGVGEPSGTGVALVVVAGAQAGGGLAMLAAPRWVRPRAGAAPVRP